VAVKGIPASSVAHVIRNFMETAISTFLSWAKKTGWDISASESPDFHLPPAIDRRYPDLPAGYLRFLKKVSRLIAPDQKAWFLTLADFAGTSDSSFRWNEWELMSIEAAADNKKWVSAITSFWNHHFPIYVSVRNGYSFFAVNAAENHGAVFSGSEPEFEEVEKVSDSFLEFLDKFISGRIAV
jgi:hypothetical protein